MVGNPATLYYTVLRTLLRNISTMPHSKCADALSTSAIMVPYVFSAFYYFKVVCKGEDTRN